MLLASIYLLYLPYAEFALDDWFVLGRYQAAREAGAGEQIHVAGLILRNQFHDQFRFQWLSFSLGYLLWLLVGYAPRVVFVVIVASHTACAALLRAALEALGVGFGPAFLSGVLFLLLPTTHGALFWSFNCLYYVWSTLWFLLYLRTLAPSLMSGQIERGAAVRMAVFLLLALFSGDPIFTLLLAAAPLAAWFLRSRAGVRATLLACATVGIAAALYALLINKARMMSSGVGLRYDFSAPTLRGNFLAILDAYRRLTGVTADAYYRLQPTAAAAVAGVGAACVTAFCLRGEKATRRPWRALALAAGLWAAAYGPIWFLRGHELRYDYVPSPYLALAMALAALAWPVVRLPLAAVLACWFAVATVAEIEQCWIPQSRNLRALEDKLRQMKQIQPGDLVIVSGAPAWVGTAPHFALQAGGAAKPFAEHVTGVRGLEVAPEIVEEGGRLRVLDSTYIRDLKVEETSRTRVLVVEPDGRLTERRLLAEPAGHGVYRLYALKGYAGPPTPPQPLTREQLALVDSEVYFARSYSHHPPRH